MRYDALTIDAQTVEHNSFHFDGGLLAQLKQFKEGPTAVIVSEVVLAEIVKHLAEKTRGAKDALEAAQKKAADYGLSAAGNPAEVGEEIDVRLLAVTRLRTFLKAVGATPVSVDSISVRELMRLYFRPAPPFSASGKKKNEFPDAIALLSLEAWAEAGNKRIVAVSGDKDWAAYAERSKRIDVVAGLAEALALLQEHTETAEETVQKLLVDIETKANPHLAEQFERLIENEVSGYAVDGTGDSAYHTVSDQVDLTFRSFNFLGDSTDRRLSVVQVGSGTVVARVELELAVTAEASFSFSMYNSIDKDYVGLGSAQVTRDLTFEAAALITFAETEDAGWCVDEIELVDTPDTIDFGTVEPDYGREYEED